MRTIYRLNGQQIDINRPREINGVRYPHLRSVWQDVGVEQANVEDYPDPNIYTWQENADGTLIVTPIPQEELDRRHNATIQGDIDHMEKEAMLPRVTREFMLAAFEAQAAAAGVDPMLNVGYARMKELDTKIADMRRSKK